MKIVAILIKLDTTETRAISLTLLKWLRMAVSNSAAKLNSSEKEKIINSAFNELF